ncbi:spore germination protein [Paenibacillus alkalitolerans]|uniref:spore germination protein n=1 Tax=Paenibacillus alkalitolerans TaxID=2799335 RepID=UPI0018F3359B|nr:spore germination protein [Paenibacillus alkalitolerans]
MPAIVGNIKIVSVGSAAIVQFGDAIQLSPQSTAKTFAGAGSFNTGDFPQTYNAISATNTNDPDVNDSAQTDVGNQGVI